MSHPQSVFSLAHRLEANQWLKDFLVTSLVIADHEVWSQQDCLIYAYSHILPLLEVTPPFQLSVLLPSSLSDIFLCVNSKTQSWAAFSQALSSWDPLESLCEHKCPSRASWLSADFLWTVPLGKVCRKSLGDNVRTQQEILQRIHRQLV